MIAATVSPPPAIENAFESAIACASVSVPLANGSISNTPTGPFQTMVPAFFSAAASAFALSGPMSRIISSGCTSSTALILPVALAERFAATTTSSAAAPASSA